MRQIIFALASCAVLAACAAPAPRQAYVMPPAQPVPAEYLTHPPAVSADNGPR